MSISTSSTPCFLVEWYQPDLAAISFDEAVTKLQQVAAHAHICLRGAVTAPTDETTFAVIEAESAEAVIAACRQAGWHTDRVTPVTRANLTA